MAAPSTDATPMRRIKQATKKNEDRKKMVRRLKKKSKQTFEMVYVVLFVLLCIAGSLGVARRKAESRHRPGQPFGAASSVPGVSGPRFERPGDVRGRASSVPGMSEAASPGRSTRPDAN